VTPSRALAGEKSELVREQGQLSKHTLLFTLRGAKMAGAADSSGEAEDLEVLVLSARADLPPLSTRERGQIGAGQGVVGNGRDMVGLD
jgi:hypothetical protein